MTETGVYRNTDYGKQLIHFDGMVYNRSGKPDSTGKISPTDIDGCMELNDKAWLIYEVKRVGTDISTGQRIALERLTEDLAKTGKYVICIIGEHNAKSANDLIYLKDCKVRQMKIGSKPWREPDFDYTVKEATDRALDQAFQ